jgi:DNA-binding NtrC family response regulator
MKRQVLFVGYDISHRSEISAFLDSRLYEARFAGSADMVIQLLESEKISAVVLKMHQLNDAAILKYINKYYPEIKVLVFAGRKFDNFIHMISRGNFRLLPQPLKLRELGMLM